jgi:hypothetical protein
MYGIIPMMARQCRAIGGTMNGSPGDTTWTDCHVNIGKKATRGLVSSGAQDATCPDCPWGRVQTTRAVCGAMGGFVDSALPISGYSGTPSNTDVVACHMNFTDKPGFGIFPPGKCPKAPCYSMRLNTKSADCTKLGGTPSSTGEWSWCTLGTGPM